MSARATTPAILIERRGRLGAYAADWEALALDTLRRVAPLAGLNASHELSLVLCDNPAIQRINRRWRAMDKPTDVLSFPQFDLKPGAVAPAGPLGDIVVALPTVRQAAREMGLDPRRHLARLLVHGLLHLLGHDHQNTRQAALMEREEERLLGWKVS